MATKQYADINGLTEFYDGIVQKISDDLASYYTKTQVDSLISAITTLDIEVVQTLPTQDISQTTIYLVPKSTAQTSNTYDEYINTDGTSSGWELIGSTAIDLSGYVQKSQTAGLLKNDGTVNTTIEGAVSANASAITAIKDGTNIDSFGDVETALMGKMKSYALDKNIAVEMDLGGNESLVTQTTSNITSGSTAIPTSGAVYNYAFPRSEQAVLGAKNLFNYDAWKGTGVHNGTAVYENNGVTVTSTSNDCYTEFDSNLFPVEARIPVKAGVTYKITWDSDETVAKGRVFVFGNASTTSMANADNNVGKLEYTPAEGVTFVTMRFGVNTSGNTIHYKNIMFGLASDTDPTYARFAMTNEQLTNAVVPTFTGTTAEWNALTSAQKSAYTIVNLTDDFVYSRLSDIYSTDERVVGVWIDSKPIYQKTIDCGYLLNNDRKSVAHNISNIDKIVEFKAFSYDPASANSNFKPLPHPWFTSNTDPTWQWSHGLMANKTNIIIVTYGDRTSEYAYVTIQYTKTTDA